METVRFDELDLYPQVLRAIKEMGFEEATPIQSQAHSVEDKLKQTITTE